MNESSSGVSTNSNGSFSSCSSTCWNYNSNCLCFPDNLLVFNAMGKTITNSNKNDTEEKEERKEDEATGKGETTNE